MKLQTLGFEMLSNGDSHSQIYLDTKELFSGEPPVDKQTVKSRINRPKSKHRKRSNKARFKKAKSKKLTPNVRSARRRSLSKIEQVKDFFLSELIFHPNEYLKEGMCGVCYEKPDKAPDSVLLTGNLGKFSVHDQCRMNSYADFEKSEWLGERGMEYTQTMDKNKFLTETFCQFCLKKDGILKHTPEVGWVHIGGVNQVLDVGFVKLENKENLVTFPVVFVEGFDLEKLHDLTGSKLCRIGKEKGGVKVDGNYRKCKNYFHPWCAIKHGIITDEINQYFKNYEFTAHPIICQTHLKDFKNHVNDFVREGAKYKFKENFAQQQIPAPKVSIFQSKRGRKKKNHTIKSVTPNKVKSDSKFGELVVGNVQCNKISSKVKSFKTKKEFSKPKCEFDVKHAKHETKLEILKCENGNQFVSKSCYDKLKQEADIDLDDPIEETQDKLRELFDRDNCPHKNYEVFKISKSKFLMQIFGVPEVDLNKTEEILQRLKEKPYYDNDPDIVVIRENKTKQGNKNLKLKTFKASDIIGLD